MKMNRFRMFTDGLVSYNVPVGQQMNLPAYPVYLNDSVYDGAIIHRCVNVSCFLATLGFFFLYVICASSSSSSSSLYCCAVTIVNTLTQIRVVSGFRMFLLGIVSWE